MAATATARATAPTRNRPQAAPGTEITYGIGRAAHRHLHVVERPPRRSLRPITRRRLALLGVGIALALGVLGNVGLHAVGAASEFRLDKLNSHAQTREADYQRLRLEVARLEAPKRIVDEANRMGLVQPPTITYLSPNDRTEAPGLSNDAPSTTVQTGGATGWQEVKPHLSSGR